MSINLPPIGPLELQQINYGLTPEDGLGDSLTVAAEKLNNNFNKLSENVRPILKNDLNLYVSNTGSDADDNDGTDQQNPLRTLAKAATIAYHDYDLNGYQVFINLLGGTYNESLHLRGLPYGARPGQAALVFQKATGDPTWNVPDTAQAAVMLTGGADVSLVDICLGASKATANLSRRCIVAIQHSNVRISGVKFCDLQAAVKDDAVHIYLRNSYLTVEKYYTILSGAGTHIEASDYSRIYSCKECAEPILSKIVHASTFTQFLKLSRNSICEWEPTNHIWEIISPNEGTPLNRGLYYTKDYFSEVKSTASLPPALSGFSTSKLVIDSLVEFQGALTLPSDLTVQGNLSVQGALSLANALNLQSVGGTTLTPSLTASDNSIVNAAWVKSVITDAINSTAVPVGTIQMSASTIVPTGWLPCDGRQLLPADYPELYNAIGTAFNQAGDPANLFRLPFSTGRSPLGTGFNGQGASHVRGSYFGTEAETLTVNQMPSHSHTINQTPHSHSISDPGHVHPIDERLITEGVPGGGLGGITKYESAAIPTTAGAFTGISVNQTTVNLSLGSTGGNLPVNNFHPVFVVNFWIKVI